MADRRWDKAWLIAVLLSSERMKVNRMAVYMHLEHLE